MELNQLRSRYRGALLAVPIGDAMGMPVETMSHESIMALNEGQGVLGFMAPVQKRFPEIALLSPGDATDDWQLTAAVARSIIRTDGKFNLEDCANEHIEEYKKNQSTWGKSTREAIAELAEGTRKPSVPPGPKPKRGLGNGVIMKIAPLALSYYGLQYKPPMLWKDCRALGQMTHSDIRASIAAFAIAELMLQMAYAPVRDVAFIIAALQSNLHDIRVIEGKEGVSREVSESIRQAIRLYKNKDELREKVGCGFSALETAPFCIGTFLRHPTDFHAGVLEAVNAGGDTDTNASIVGALIAANVGIDGIPDEWKEQCPVRQEALGYADKLLEFATRLEPVE